MTRGGRAVPGGPAAQGAGVAAPGSQAGGAALTFWRARARDTPGSPTSWRVFLPRTGNFCRLTFTSNGLGLGLARPPRAPAGAPAAWGRARAFPMASSRRAPRRPTPRPGDPTRRDPTRQPSGGRSAGLREARAGPRVALASRPPGDASGSSAPGPAGWDYNSQQAALAGALLPACAGPCGSCSARGAPPPPQVGARGRWSSVLGEPLAGRRPSCEKAAAAAAAVAVAAGGGGPAGEPFPGVGLGGDSGP